MIKNKLCNNYNMWFTMCCITNEGDWREWRGMGKKKIERMEKSLPRLTLIGWEEKNKERRRKITFFLEFLISTIFLFSFHFIKVWNLLTNTKFFFFLFNSSSFIFSLWIIIPDRKQKKRTLKFFSKFSFLLILIPSNQRRSYDEWLWNF